MQLAGVLLLFLIAVCWGQSCIPSDCCLPSQYVMYLHVLDKSNQDDLEKSAVAVDYDKQIRSTRYTVPGVPDDHRIIEDFAKRKAHVITGGKCHTYHNMINMFLPNPCLPDDSVFVNSSTNQSEIYQTWSFTRENSNVTSTVNAMNCFPIREYIQSSNKFVYTEITSYNETIPSDMFQLLPSCKQ